MTSTHLPMLLATCLLLAPVLAGCGPSEPTTTNAPSNATASDGPDSTDQEAPPADNHDESVVESADPLPETSAMPKDVPKTQPSGESEVVPKTEVSEQAPKTTERLPEEPSAPAKAKEDPFIVPGQFSLVSPGNGYAWAELAANDVNGTTVRVLACRKDGSTSAMTLTVEHRNADSDGKRIAAAKGHFNGLVQTLQNAGFTSLKGATPSFDPPMPERFEYAITGVKPSGEPAFIKCATLFQNNVYAFAVIADTEEEADFLYGAVDTLKEM